MKPTSPIKKNNSSKADNSVISSKAESTDSKLFTDDMVKQLNTVFDRMQNSLILRLYLDERPISNELEQYMNELSDLTDKLTVEKVTDTTNVTCPCVKICKSDGNETGFAFHGVPGGHEFTSFVLSLYNMAGPGQKN